MNSVELVENLKNLTNRTNLEGFIEGISGIFDTIGNTLIVIFIFLLKNCKKANKIFLNKKSRGSARH